MTIKDELKLAIELWESIKQHLAEHPATIQLDIELIKHDFCVNHALNWLNDCWFCAHKECPDCPLYKSALLKFPSYAGYCCLDYWIATDQTNGSGKEHFTLEERLEACDNIINALNKEAEK